MSSAADSKRGFGEHADWRQKRSEPVNERQTPPAFQQAQWIQGPSGMGFDPTLTPTRNKAREKKKKKQFLELSATTGAEACSYVILF